MTIRWKPDTCNCIIDMDSKTLKFEDWVQKCSGHADKDGQDLVDTVVAHNRSFQIKIEDQKNNTKRNANVKLKRAEKNRIQKLGKVIKRGK